MEKALLVIIKLKSEKDSWHFEDISEEMDELAKTSGAEVIDSITCLCEKPTPNFFIGSGKAEEIAILCQEEEVDTVIFSRDLSGTQQRNLEEVIAKKTIDRTQLILDIFARHARSPEGKMQVELAQLQYLVPRLVGKGIALSRLGGGIGTRGPGEQKLEVDRRRIRKRIDKLQNDLKGLALHRATLRKKRKENKIPLVALVGYTNAGKSTLINAFTGGAQPVRDSLFTTLDPLSRLIQVPDGQKIVVTDTVGFLHNLPHNLIEAFKATLEEVSEADLLIHVLDVSHHLVYQHAQSVAGVLKELAADGIPIITALNKIDLVDDSAWLGNLSRDFPNPVLISAKQKQNIKELFEKIMNTFASRMSLFKIIIPNSRMDVVNLFYREGRIDKIEYTENSIKIVGTLPNVYEHKLSIDKDIGIIN